MTPRADAIKRAIVTLEHALETDGAAVAARDRGAILERQDAALYASATDAAHRLAQLTAESIEAVRDGHPYDTPALAKARADAAAKTSAHDLIAAALSDQRARVAALDRQRADRVAEQLRPVLTDALALLDARLTELAEADALVGRLHLIAQRELFGNHPDLAAGYKFTSQDRIVGWRERVQARFGAAVEA